MSAACIENVDTIGDLEFTPLCEHSAHPTHEGDEPAAYIVRSFCQCGSTYLLNICKPGWDECGRPGIVLRCGVCNAKDPRDDCWLIVHSYPRSDR